MDDTPEPVEGHVGTIDNIHVEADAPEGKVVRLNGTRGNVTVTMTANDVKKLQGIVD